MSIPTILVVLIFALVICWLLYRDYQHQSRIQELQEWKRNAEDTLENLESRNEKMQARVNKLKEWKSGAQLCIEDLYERQIRLRARTDRYKQELSAITALRVWNLQYNHVMPLRKRVDQHGLVIDTNRFANLAAVDDAVVAIRERKQTKDPATLIGLLFRAYADGNGVCEEKIAQRIRKVEDLHHNDLISFSGKTEEELKRLKNEIRFERYPV